MEEEEEEGVGCYALCVGREEWDTARKGSAARGFLFTYIIAQLPFPRIYRFPPNFRTVSLAPPLGLRFRFRFRARARGDWGFEPVDQIGQGQGQGRRRG